MYTLSFPVLPTLCDLFSILASYELLGSGSDCLQLSAIVHSWTQQASIGYFRTPCQVLAYEPQRQRWTEHPVSLLELDGEGSVNM